MTEQDRKYQDRVFNETGVFPKEIHGWFGLSYAQYLTIPRSVLQSMPLAWQHRFVTCLEELDETIDWMPQDGKQYRVILTETEEVYKTDREDGEEDGFVIQWKHHPEDIGHDDPLMDYQRGRRRIPHTETV